MRRGSVVAVVAFAVFAGAAATMSILSDRRAVLSTVEERTTSITRMIVAHGDAAIGDADTMVSAIYDRVEAWDLEDPVAGRVIFNEFRLLMVASPQISSAWITDGDGISRLNSWTYPSEPFDVTHRPYYREHLAGAPDPQILGDADPGVVTGMERFTFSRAVRDAEDALHAIIVVGIFAEHFDTLYKEAATWPDARAGLYSTNGDALARLQNLERASPAFIAQMESNVAAAPSGTKLLNEDDAMRLVSWYRSSQYPDLYASSSQTVSTALADWRARSALMGAMAVLAVAAFALFMLMNARALEARQAALVRDLALREVHHRVKNALQLIVSMIGIRARATDDPVTRCELEAVSSQVYAISEVQYLLQSAATLERVEVCALLQRLCEHLGPMFAGEIRFTGELQRDLETAQAANVAIIANELVTNAIKHARDLVEVRCDVTDSAITITVSDDGPGLPSDFSFSARDRFGLRAARHMAESIGASLATTDCERTGAGFRLRLPARTAA